MDFVKRFTAARGLPAEVGACEADTVFGYLKRAPGFEQNYATHAVLNTRVQEGLDAGLVHKGGVPMKEVVDTQIAMQRTLLEFELERGKKEGVDVDDAFDVLSYGFVTNVDLPRGETVDDMISIVVSLCVQKNIPLPPPFANETKIEWFRECVGNLLKGTTTQSGEQQQSLKEPETALRDLQFSHEYLAKKYQDEVNQHAKALKRMQDSDGHLENVTNEMVRLARDGVQLRNENGRLRGELNEKDQRIYELERELALVKVDRIGTSVNGVANDQLASPPPSGPATASVSLLRSEFKRIVQDLNKRHAEEMERVLEMAR